MKKLLFLFLLFIVGFSASAAHIKGGFFTYKYIGPGTADPSKLKYEIVLTVYMQCNPSSQQLNDPINFSIYDGASNAFIKNVSVPLTNRYELFKTADEQCITGNQIACYYTIVEYKLETIELEPRSGGYTISYQRCCRIAGIMNISNSGSIGNTYSIGIPGTSVGQEAEKNSSARFNVNDTAVVCRNSYFQYSFLATDPDGNRLTYEFCDAWQGGNQGDPAPATAAPPPYALVPYPGGFTGSAPLGPGVTINPNTGLISGIAPDLEGEFVITVCVNEYKNNVLIAKNRKELHIKIGDCAPIQAVLDPVYPTCDGFTRTFSNNSPPNPDVHTYYWDFGDGNNSTQMNPTHTYADTGVYKLTLIVNRGEQCTDTATALVKVFPGFFPHFTFSGICINKPTQFKDSTITRYGVVDSWSWNFGDLSTNADTSRIQNPTWTYSQTGPKVVTFIATNSKGCIDTITRTVQIGDKPALQVGFKDTTICKGDAVQLKAIGEGNFSWTPTIEILGADTDAPTVTPSVTRTYKVELNQQGCIANDSVKVTVVNSISVMARADTTICFSDSVQLSAVTNGLKYEWTPANEVQNPTVLNTMVKPARPGTNTYNIRVYLGGCVPVDDQVVITAVPYPQVSIAADDDTICFNSSTVLHATTDGTNLVWTPASGLSSASVPDPVASPAKTTRYTLTVTSPSSGCPKPASDTLVLTVLPKIFPFAGNDTAVIAGQSLQFNATGGVRYQWAPATDLSATNIFNPIGTYRGNYDSIRYQVSVYDVHDCVDSAFITVKIFRTTPQIFVPTAFTPNRDGRNDRIRPIAVGIAKIEYFRVFNRWGQMVFQTTINGDGWDGRINGKDQGTNVFVWLVKAVDYLGQEFFAKGTVTLIR